MKNQNTIFLFLGIISAALLTVSQTKNNGLIFQLSKSYPNLDVPKVIRDFGNQLVNDGILELNELSNPSAIYNKLEASYRDLSPSEFNISKIIERGSLNEILSNEDILNAAESTQAQIALFTYYQLVSENYSRFTFHLQEERLVQYSGEDLPINSLESVIFEEIQKRTENGVNVNNAQLTITADEYTDIEFVHFIMSKFREMGISKVAFSNK